MKQFLQGTAGNLVEYLQSLIEDGFMSNGQIAPLKSAVTTVMSVAEGDAWVYRNVFDVDVEEVMRRFVERTSTRYSEQSISSYKSRVGRALSWYKRHLDDPEWTPVSLDSAWAKHHARQINDGINHLNHNVYKRSVALSPTGSNVQLISYPFPLRAGQVAQLNLPADLTREEAQRLGVFINSIVWREEGDEM